MADAMVIADSRAAARVSKQTRFSPTGEVLRDIARGGISGAIVGIAVGGLGGRVVMRVVAILHPDAVGALTENGNRIGHITVGGTLFLVLFGLISCALAGALWVIVSPSIPGHTGVRALLTAGIAITIGTPLLIIGRNPDFVILDHDPRVVSLLVALVGLIGLSIALLDSWLDRRLPHAFTGRKGPAVFYDRRAAGEIYRTTIHRQPLGSLRQLAPMCCRAPGPKSAFVQIADVPDPHVRVCLHRKAAGSPSTLARRPLGKPMQLPRVPAQPLVRWRDTPLVRVDRR